MTTDDRPYRGRSTADGADDDAETDGTRRAEPDLWEELGLEADDELPQVPDGPGDVPDARPVPRQEANEKTGEHEQRFDRGRVMAILAHMSVMFGVPVFLIPLVLRKDALALHHSKAAAVVFFAFYAALFLAMFTSSVFLPVAMALYIPGLVAIGRAVQKRRAGHLGFGSLGEALFPWPKPR